jgi:thioredoxin reductase (NADPH)
MSAEYDVVIIGSGPAGLTAGIYCGRAKLNTVILEKGNPGGSIINADLVENFPGFPQGISGANLSADMMTQAMQLGVRIEFTEVTSINLVEDFKMVSTTGHILSAKAVIIASGGRYKKLGIPGEEEFNGRGVSYCAMCDGTQFADKDVAVVGGGEGGLSEGLYLTRIASKVTIIEITPRLNAPRVLQERAKANSKIDILCSTKVKAISEVKGAKNLRIENIATGGESDLKVEGAFIAIGLEPDVEYLHGLVELDNKNFIKVTSNMETDVPGVFAAGDIRSGSARQAITAAADGAVATLSAERFIALGQRGKSI